MWYFPSTSTDISARYATNTGMMSRRMTDREVGVNVYRLRRNGGWIEMQKDHIQSLDPEKLDDINGGISIPADLLSNEGIAAFCTAVDRIASTRGRDSALSYNRRILHSGRPDRQYPRQGVCPQLYREILHHARYTKAAHRGQWFCLPRPALVQETDRHPLKNIICSRSRRS